MSAFTERNYFWLIIPTRTLSTVFLRAMHARGDMIIFNEPAQYSYLAKRKPDVLDDMYNSTILFTTYAKVKETLLITSEKKNVFVKDSPCAAYECLFEDDMFLSNPNIEFCFLIRDPHPSLVSYYKAEKRNSLSEINWDIDWVVYEHQFALFDKIRRLKNKPPVVISAELLSLYPEEGMRLFCEKMNIKFKQEMLNWPSLEHNFNPLDWNDYKKDEACERWHKNAIISTHFKSCKRYYEVDENGSPTFVELSSEIRDAVKKIYDYYMKFYTPLFKYAID